MQAIALLVQMRLPTLKRWQDVEPLLDRDRAGESTEWGWRFYVALSRALWNADLDPLDTICAEAPDGPSVAATNRMPTSSIYFICSLVTRLRSCAGSRMTL